MKTETIGNSNNLIPIGISKNDKDKVFDLLLYKNHYALIKKLNVCWKTISKISSVEDF